MQLTPPAMLEALLFASGAPLSKKRLANLLGVSSDMLEKASEALSISLQGRGLALIETETEIELRTAPEASELVLKLRENELARDLGKAGLETLAVVLYSRGNRLGTWRKLISNTPFAFASRIS
jgi:chromosome segregation and condensation protein ScpB